MVQQRNLCLYTASREIISRRNVYNGINQSMFVMKRTDVFVLEFLSSQTDRTIDSCIQLYR